MTRPNLSQLDAALPPLGAMPPAAPALGEAASPRRLLGSGFWAVADQGAFAGSNLLLNILMAKWVGPADYGAFTVSFSVFLLLATVHTALLSEPMLIYGPGRYRARLSEYLNMLVVGHWAFSAVSLLLLLATAAVFALLAKPTLAIGFGAVALSGPAILYLWLLKRTCYAHLRPRVAVSGGVIYALIMLAGLWGLNRYAWLSIATAYAVQGVASLIAAIWIGAVMGVSWPWPLDRQLARSTLKDHMDYGRWAVATSAMGWAPTNFYFLLLPIWGGLQATGAFRAVTLLIMPILQAHWSMAGLLVPMLVHARRSGADVMQRLMRQTLAFFACNTILYWLLMGFLGRYLLRLLYHDQYSQYASILWIVGLLPLTTSVISVFGAGLRAYERPDLMFWAYALGTLFTLTAGCLLVLCLGLGGAAISSLVASAITAAVASYMIWRLGAPSSLEAAP